MKTFVFVIFGALLLLQGTTCSVDDSSNGCEPGSTWKEDCNSCTCTSTGVPVCTKIGCLNVNQQPSGTDE